MKKVPDSGAKYRQSLPESRRVVVKIGSKVAVPETAVPSSVRTRDVVVASLPDLPDQFPAAVLSDSSSSPILSFTSSHLSFASPCSQEQSRAAARAASAKRGSAVFMGAFRWGSVGSGILPEAAPKSHSESSGPVAGACGFW